jgi:hypothetical protein
VVSKTDRLFAIFIKKAHNFSLPKARLRSG